MNSKLANCIAHECLVKFDALQKTGKPNEAFEWTILSAIVLVRTSASLSQQPRDTVTEKDDDKSFTVQVVALGTGTKCLGGTELSPRGDLVNDSHAEILARRAFIRYLLEQIERAAEGVKDSVFERVSPGGKFVLKDGHSFHFFTTHSPCGDASIFELATSNASDDEEPPTAKRPRGTAGDDGEENVGSVVTSGKTGGKLLQPLSDTGCDLMAQTIGAVRTKPGRGVRTLSVSCSDKMARWAVLGVQGSLLMLLLGKPIYLASVVLCEGTAHSATALRRAIWGRFEKATKDSGLRHPFSHNCPEIVAANNGTPFRFRKNRPLTNNTGMYQPSPCGIVWSNVSVRPHEVEVSGRRHGVTKRKLATPAARLRISKIELFASFVRTYVNSRLVGDGNGGAEGLHNLVSTQWQRQHNHATADHPGEHRARECGQPQQRQQDGCGQRAATVAAMRDVGERLSGKGIADDRQPADIAKLSYAAAKALSVDYRRQWTDVRDTVFGGWTKKPDSFGQFFIDADAWPELTADRPSGSC
ncbi:tRNA-specific adenosine deaminase 1 [Anopheles cruzii]|uniref:tRNA-specific adenosine deaminase 1 n=1 Tax=Anopheles cruzii TaxID=68878 RepID=UPI0022EC68A0|nr:tRNA-specific adenosine deaminase 1 [Anopheles cruzii]